MNIEEISAKLAPVVRRVLGADTTVHALAQLTGGAAKRTYVFTARAGECESQLILQLASRPTALVAELTPRLGAEQDAALMQAAAVAGVDAPVVRTVLVPGDGLGAGFITEFVQAEALGRKIVHDAAFAPARARFAAQCGINLAAIHRIPTAAHPWLMPYPAAQQVEAYARELQHYGVQHPALAYGFAWARQHMPGVSTMALVHGDFRMGNLMADAEGLRLVLDWEVAHLGDPMQDLAWLCLRTWRFGGAKPVAGVGEREELFQAYEAAGGRRVDREAVFFWEAFGNLKWAVMALRKGLRHRDGGRPLLEECAIGRRTEEPLWDFFQVLEEGVH